MSGALPHKGRVTAWLGPSRNPEPSEESLILSQFLVTDNTPSELPGKSARNVGPDPALLRPCGWPFRAILQSAAKRFNLCGFLNAICRNRQSEFSW